MIYLIIGCAVCLLVVFLLGLTYRFSDVVDDTLLVVLISTFVFIGVGLGGTAVISYWVAENQETICQKRGEEMNRDIKFAQYGTWSWECLTPVGDSWISIDSVIKTE